MARLEQRSAPPKYRGKHTERFASGERIKEFQTFKEQAERRLDILEAALSRIDLMLLPSNRFEALGWGPEGPVQYSHQRAMACLF